MKNISWNDGMLHGARTPRLFFVKDGKIHQFSGENIENVVLIKSRDYNKNGKWSSTSYDLAVADNVGIWIAIAKMHNGYWDQYATWEEAMSHVVSETGKMPEMEELKRVVKDIYYRAYERFEANESALTSFEVSDSIDFVFGGPTKAQTLNGYWESTKTSEVGVLSLPKGMSWLEAKSKDIVCPSGYVCTNITHKSGYNGGYCTVQLKKINSKEEVK